MRYYKIDITTPSGAQIFPKSLKGQKLSSLLPNGQFNPAALNIEIDISVVLYHEPEGQGFIRIWGLSLEELSASSNLNDALISIYAGMSKGLPLANPGQARLIAKGKIFQAFGNWIGVDQTLDILFRADTGSIGAPKNIVLNWTAGTTLASALSNTFQVAYPRFKQDINISPRLVRSYDDIGYYPTLEALSVTVNGISKAIITDPKYAGVNISLVTDTIVVRDFTGPPNPSKEILFQDLLGQPTWLDSVTIQAKVVMRGDIQPLDVVTMPRGLITNSAVALTRFRDNTAFTGKYIVKRVHYYGDFRQPDAMSWNTTLDMSLESGGKP